MTALSATVLVGTVLHLGAPCADLRLDDGRTIAISAVPEHVRPGDRVELHGRYRFSFACQKDIFAVRDLKVLGGR